MRGLRPIAEIQYLDYLLFGLEPISDDLATLQYRTRVVVKRRRLSFARVDIALKESGILAHHWA